MSRMSELSSCIADLKAAAAALISAADALTDLYSSEEPAPADKPTPAPITKEQVRTILAAKTAEGYGAQVRALLRKYGATQLSAVKPADYSDLMLEAQAIGNEVDADG